MAAAAPSSMDHRNPRLSVTKSSSFKISKPSAPSHSHRPPATLVSADLNNFRRIVQQLTGTPPPSASSSPVRESTRSSRLQRIAPPSLRPFLHQQPLPPTQQHQEVWNSPLLHHQPHHHFTPHNTRAHDDDQPPQQHDFSWLSSVGLFSPPLPYTQVANFNQNTDSNFTACINPSPHPNPNPLLLSPHQLAALPTTTPSDSIGANLLHALPSPRPLSNSAASLPPLLPLPSASAEAAENRGGHNSRRQDFERLALGLPSLNHHPFLPSSSNVSPLLAPHSNGHPLLAPSSYGHSLLPSPANCHPLLSSSSCNGSNIRLFSSSSSNEQSLLGPLPRGDPLLPSPHTPLIPVSPSTFLNSWLPPWPPSPFLPLPFSPGLFPPSPGLGSFMSSSGGFSFCGTNEHQSKLP